MLVCLAVYTVPVHGVGDVCACECCNYNHASCVSPPVSFGWNCDDPGCTDQCINRYECTNYQFPIMFPSCTRGATCGVPGTPLCDDGSVNTATAMAVGISITIVVVLAGGIVGILYFRRRKASRVALAVASSSPYSDSTSPYTKIMDNAEIDIVKA